MNKIKVIFGRKSSCSEHILKKTSLICDSDDVFGAQHIPCIWNSHLLAQHHLHSGKRFIVGWTTRWGFFVSTLTVTWTSSAISDMDVLSPDTHQLGSPVQLPRGEEGGSMEALRSWAGGCACWLSNSGKKSSVAILKFHFLLHYPKTDWI